LINNLIYLVTESSNGCLHTRTLHTLDHPSHCNNCCCGWW